MIQLPERNITIGADYDPPSVDRWTPEDDLAQKLFAPHPVDVRHESTPWSGDLFIGVVLIVFMPIAVFILLVH